jgi:hypothetical protein
LAYRIHGAGKVRRMSLGRVSDVTLEKARERSNELTGAARTGRDLIAEEVESQTTAAARGASTSFAGILLKGNEY